jgi:flagellar biosynthesis chaperone FliJ
MTTIAVDEYTHQQAKTLCKTFELTLGELVQHGVLYFKKTGIDPSKSGSENPNKAIQELNKTVGQLVNLVTKHQQEKVVELFERLLNLTESLEKSQGILPKSERFEQVVKLIVDHTNLLEDHHVKRMDFLTESRQEIMQENKTQLSTLTTAIDTLTKALNSLQTEQQAIKKAIETKLGKKIFS